MDVAMSFLFEVFIRSCVFYKATLGPVRSFWHQERVVFLPIVKLERNEKFSFLYFETISNELFKFSSIQEK